MSVRKAADKKSADCDSACSRFGSRVKFRSVKALIKAARSMRGSIYSEELGTRYDLIMKSGALSVQVGHNEEIPVIAQKKDFSWPVMMRKSSSRGMGNGVITGFAVSTGRVLNLKFAKLRP